MIQPTSTLPAYLTAEQLAGCDLSADDGLQRDQNGGISRADFLRWFAAVTREVAKIFTSENF